MIEKEGRIWSETLQARQQSDLGITVGGCSTRKESIRTLLGKIGHEAGKLVDTLGEVSRGVALSEPSVWWLYSRDVACHDVNSPRELVHLVDVERSS